MNGSYPPPKGLACSRAFLVVLLEIALVIWREILHHELCHLHYHDHGPNFYRLLEKVMPDWEKRKAKLELALV